jgi:hypothetical protein
MRRCEDCKIILDNTVRYCPKCGRSVAPGGISADAPNSDVSSLLASANLHRIRQEWDAAVSDATEALKLEPKNADIASVLGEIYEQRGMHEDALIWYQMALEMNPDSAPDKMRLEKLTSRITGSMGNGTDSFRIFQRRTKTWAIAMGAAFLLIVLFAIIITRRAPKTEGGDAVTAPPISVPREGIENNQPNAPSAVSTPNDPRSYSSPSLAGRPGPVSGALRTAPESKIISDMREVREAGAKVDDVIADPRHGVVIVTFTVPAATANKSTILTAAASLAKSAFAANAEVKFVTARCVVGSGDVSTTQVAFVGDIARESVQSLGDAPTPEALASAFTNPWWNQ